MGLSGLVSKGIARHEQRTTDRTSWTRKTHSAWNWNSFAHRWGTFQQTGSRAAIRQQKNCRFSPWQHLRETSSDQSNASASTCNSLRNSSSRNCIKNASEQDKNTLSLVVIKCNKKSLQPWSVIFLMWKAALLWNGQQTDTTDIFFLSGFNVYHLQSVKTAFSKRLGQL